MISTHGIGKSNKLGGDVPPLAGNRISLIQQVKSLNELIVELQVIASALDTQLRPISELGNGLKASEESANGDSPIGGHIPTDLQAITHRASNVILTLNRISANLLL